MGDKPDYVNGEPKPIPNNGPSMHDLVAADLKARKQYGLAKYDSLLQAYNGRNFLQDIYEEMQDGIVYLRGALEEQKVAANLIKFLLERLVAASPEDGPALVFEGKFPGWILQIVEETLGDKFEYRAGGDDSSSKGSQRSQVWDYLSQG